MTDIEKQEETKVKTDYNKEPVYYCIHCLSLKIMKEEDFDYCDECGSTDIAQTSIENWEKLYKEKYSSSSNNTKDNN